MSSSEEELRPREPQQRSSRGKRYAKISSYSRSGSPSGSVWSTLSAQSRMAEKTTREGRSPDQRTPKSLGRTSPHPTAERARTPTGGNRREGKPRAAARVSVQQVHAQRDAKGGSSERGSRDIRSYMVRRDRVKPAREPNRPQQRGGDRNSSDNLSDAIRLSHISDFICCDPKLGNNI